jgi:hypothetical protein
VSTKTGQRQLSINRQYVSTTENDVATTRSASTTLVSSTPCLIAQGITIYEDKLFNNFAFYAPTAPTANCNAWSAADGFVVDAYGNPMADKAVTITYADGSSFVTHTNDLGRYVVLSVDGGETVDASIDPPGVLQVVSNGPPEASGGGGGGKKCKGTTCYVTH